MTQNLQHPQQVFEAAIAARAFPGGVAYLARDRQVLLHQSFGTTAHESDYSRSVTTDTIYDIASISKLFTATATLIAARESGVSVDEPLAKFLPQFATVDKGEITIRHLLLHNSGIEIAVQALIKTPSESWISQIAAAPLRSVPGKQVLYSCTNFFLLGRLVGQWSGASLDAFINERLLRPLEMRRTRFFPLQQFTVSEIAPTELIDDLTDEENKPRVGIVHDEAARTWEAENTSACGNAGVFSTACDLARFAQMWLDEGACGSRQIIAPEDVRRALTETFAGQEDDRGLGWHLNATSWMSAQAPRGCAGHSGFTGPTMFITPQAHHICVVLNNRVYPTRNGPPRMGFHGQIAEWLFAQDEQG